MGIDISYIALDTIADIAIKKDVKLQKAALKNPRPFLSAGRKLSDDELKNKLELSGLEINKNELTKLCEKFLSSEKLSVWLTDKYKLKEEGSNSDWIWICLTVLWERWFPEIINFEMIDTKIQLGYMKQEKSDVTGACDIWYETWENILYIIGSTKINSISEFDSAFRGTQSIFNWCQDFEMELGNAGVENRIYYKKRIEYCEKIISAFEDIDNLILENMRRAIAESYSNLGNSDKSDNLFELCLKNDPGWGWGWIGWADCYSMYANKNNKDLEKAESILYRGYKIKGLRDKDILIERLSDLYEETGKKEKSREILKNKGNVTEEKDHITDYAIKIMDGEEALSQGEFEENTPYFFGDKNPVNFSGETSVSQYIKKKIGRNEPCPCGSGKKYKKCCGR